MRSVESSKNQILEQFRSFRRRYARRERWNMLLSGLIVVFTLWLLTRIAGQMLVGVEYTFWTSAILVIGIGITLFKVYQNTLDQRTAAYVFDRMHGLEGAFLTFRSLLPTEEDGPSSDTKRMHEALVGRIRQRLTDKPEPPMAFPTSRALVCLLLLAVGLALPETNLIHSRPTAGTLQDRQTTMNRNDSDDHNDSGTNQQGQSVKSMVGAERPSEKRKQRSGLQQQKRRIDGDGNKQNERELHKDTPSDQDQLETSTTSDRTKKTTGSEAADQRGNKTPSSPSTPRDGSGTSGTGERMDVTGDDTDRPLKQRSLPRTRRQEKPVEQTAEQLPPSMAPSASSTEDDPSSTSRLDEPGGGVDSDVFSTDLTTAQEPGSYRINWTQLGEAVRRPRRVQTWHPKYDRSISRYRSRLASFVSSRDQTNVSDQ